jgi:PilZ domain
MPDNTKDAAVETGRVDPRYPAEALPGVTSMRLSPGDAVRLVNISASGVLVEGKTRFVPGTRVSVIFEGPAAPKAVKGKVVRCLVSSIGGGGSLQYQSAIAFEAKIDLPVDEAALPHQAAPAADRPKTSSGQKAAAPPPAAVNRW